jgi:energy-coupling factor transporter ATP-binding protein EcfA2
MKHSDRPIFRPREDLLGRAKFSLTLAHAIDNLTIAKDGFVVAIMGEWGSGKSSVVEMTTRFLIHLEMERASNGTEKHTLDSLEPLAETFDRVRDSVINRSKDSIGYHGQRGKIVRWKLRTCSEELGTNY